MPNAKTPPTTPSKMDNGPNKDIAKRLKKDPTDEDAQLDEGLDESFPASDVPSEVIPEGDHEKPAPSTSGGD